MKPTNQTRRYPGKPSISPANHPFTCPVHKGKLKGSDETPLFMEVLLLALYHHPEFRIHGTVEASLF